MASLIFQHEPAMKEKILQAAKYIAPVLLMVWFSYRFYTNIAHYHSHAEDILTPFVEFVCVIFSAVTIYRACRQHEWITVVLYALTALSASFFCFCIWQIPFCTECDHITRSDLHPILKPFEDTFAPYWDEVR